MSFLFRSNRLAAYRDVHFMLQANYKASYISSGYMFDDDLRKIVDHYTTDVNLFYKNLESKLYDSSKSKELDNELDRVHKLLLAAADNAGDNATHKAHIRARINGSFMTPFYNSYERFEHDFNYTISATLHSLKPRSSRIFSKLPLIQDIYQVDSNGQNHFKDNIVSNLFLSLLNPVKIIDSLLTFIEMGVNRIIDAGLQKNQKTPLPQAALKGVIGAMITAMKVPLTILKPVSEIIPALANNLLINPARYAVNKITNYFVATNVDSSNENKKSISCKSNTSSVAIASGILSASTVATVAATTTVKTTPKGISTNTSCGPLQASSYIHIADHNLSSGNTQGLNLGPVVSVKQTHNEAFGSKGVSSSNSQACNMGGCHGYSHNETHSSCFTKSGLTTKDSSSSSFLGTKCSSTTEIKWGHGNIFDFKEHGSFFGEKYNVNFRIPAPQLPVGEFFKHAGANAAHVTSNVSSAVVNHGSKVISHMSKVLKN